MKCEGIKILQKNQEKLAALGLLQKQSASEKAKGKLKQANEDAGESDYLPSNDPARESENEKDDIVTSKVQANTLLDFCSTFMHNIYYL